MMIEIWPFRKKKQAPETPSANKTDQSQTLSPEEGAAQRAQVNADADAQIADLESRIEEETDSGKKERLQELLRKRRNWNKNETL